MPHFLFISCLLLSFQINGQIIYLSSGFGSNSGASVAPYTDSRSLSLPWLIEAELKIEFKEHSSISFLGQRKVNKKAGEGFLSETTTNSVNHYVGVKIGRYIKSEAADRDGKRPDIEIGCNLLYGQEVVNWEDTQNSFSILYPSFGIYGSDRFHMLQTGIYSSLTWDWEASRWNFRLALSILKDFILTGSRRIDYLPNFDHSAYEEFDYRGILSFNALGGIGYKLFRK